MGIGNLINQPISVYRPRRQLNGITQVVRDQI